MSDELAVIESTPPLALFGTNDPIEVIAQAAKVATALADVVNQRKLYAVVDGKKFPQVEAWTLLGSMLGVFPITEWVHELHDGEGNVRGFEARVRAQTLSGRVVGAGEARCIRGESKNWHANAKEYALSSMAQTRATSKALRGPLDFVFKLAGFQPTPAEEMDGLAQTGEIPLSKASPASVEAMRAVAAASSPPSQEAATVPQTVAPPAAEVNSAAVREASGATTTAAPAHGPRAKRQNVVPAPVAVLPTEATSEVVTTPLQGAPGPPPAQTAPPVELDGKEIYLDTLRQEARQVAARVAHLRVRLQNHKAKQEIALGTKTGLALPPLTPTVESDAALQRFITARWPKKMLHQLEEAELDGTDKVPGVLRILNGIIEQIHNAGVSESD